MLFIDDSFVGQTVRLPVGQVIELRLQENPTTGYRWSFSVDGKPSCTVIGDRFERSQGPPGAKGQHAWQIKGVHAGNCRLELIYRRPFEPGAPPARTFTLDVLVTK